MAVTIDGTSGITTPGVVNTAAETIATTLAVTGVTTVQAGTAALPAITTTGDTNTGIFFPAADTVGVATGGSERLRVDSSGNVGIGTTAGFSDGSGVEIQRAGVATLRVDNSTSTAAGEFRADGTGTAIDCRGLEIFRVLTGGAERARIDSSGNLLVGVTSGSSNTISSGNSYAFYVAQTTTNNSVVRFDAAYSSGTTNLIAFYAASTYRGAIQFNGTSIVYATSSDYRLKEDIAPMTGALATVTQLKPVKYKWKSNGSDGQGFIAHELQAVVPDCVTGEKDAVDADGNPQYQGIDTSFLVATLTAAIQEQQALITALTTRITALEGAAA